MTKKPQSSIDWLFDQISYIEQVYIKAAKEDKSLKKGTDAILTALAIVKMRQGHAKEMHHKEIVGAWNSACGGDAFHDGEDYYNAQYNAKSKP